jgi:hypothetical protein
MERFEVAKVDSGFPNVNPRYHYSDEIALCQMQLQQCDRLLQLAQPRSPFSTQPLRDRPSDRLRCDRLISNTIPNAAVFGAGEV